MAHWESLSDRLPQAAHLFEGWIKTRARTGNPKIKIIHKNSVEEINEEEWFQQLHEGWANEERSSKS